MLSVPKALQTAVVYGRGYAWARTLIALALLLTLLMLLGRLELIAIIVLFMPGFWKNQ